jgi:hypothetical protein
MYNISTKRIGERVHYGNADKNRDVNWLCMIFIVVWVITIALLIMPQAHFSQVSLMNTPYYNCVSVVYFCVVWISIQAKVMSIAGAG